MFPNVRENLPRVIRLYLRCTFGIPGSIFTQNIIFFFKLFTYVNANGRNGKFEKVNCNILGKVEITELMSGSI